MAQSELTRVVEPICRELADSFSFELVDIELVREGSDRILRLYIDKPGGITLQDCETYHRAVIPLVECVSYDYLEVSSPGLDRPLKKQKDYDAHVGKQVEVSLFKPVDGLRHFEGELLGLADGEVSVRCGERVSRFALSNVALCKPVIFITEEDLAAAEDDDGEGDV